MKPIVKGSIITGLYLGILTCLCLSIIVAVHEKTYETFVKTAEKERLNKQMAEMLPGIKYNNDLIKSCKLYVKSISLYYTRMSIYFSAC